MALTLFIDYLWWHYMIAPRDILRLLSNYSAGLWQKFYIFQHIKTLFSPWHRLLPKYIFPSDDFGDKVSNFITDVFIRCVAAIIRLTVISFGILAQCVAAVFFISVFIVWLLWPAVSIYLIGRGVFYLFGV